MGYLSKGDRITSAEQDLIDIIGVLGSPLNILRVNAAGTSLEYAASGAGNVVGPASSTDNAVARFNLATGLLIQNSVVLIGDTGAITGALSLNLSGLTASEIVITDASKNLVSAAVATYPSLTELTYVKGVTSAIQTQITAKAPSTSPTFATSITGSYLTASEILITDGSKNVVSAAVATYPSLTELTYVKGVTSAIQTQLNTKAAALSGTINEIAYFDSGTTIASLAVATYPSLTELIYVKGVTSAIQTQINTKVTSGGALGTPSSGTGTNITGIPAANILAGSFGAGAYVISTSLQVATIELGHATENTLSAASGVLSFEGVVVPTISSTNTFTNKRITQRVVTAADDSTAVIDVDVTDQYQLTAMANATTISTTGTPTAGQKLIIRLKDNATARALTWDAVFRAVGVTLPTTTVISKTHYIGCVYNLTDTKWDAVAVVAEA